MSLISGNHMIAATRRPGDPDRDPDAWNQLGIWHVEEKRHEDALACFDRAIALQPTHARAWSNRGNVLDDLGRRAEAIDAYERAIAIEPAYANAIANLATTLIAAERPEDALARLEAAPPEIFREAKAAAVRGMCLAGLGRPEDALPWLDKALAINPHMVDIRLARAFAHLVLGHFDQGWEDYQSRFKSHFWGSGYTGPDVRSLDDIRGRHLLVLAEQGLGDMIQCARYIPRLVDEGVRVTFQVLPALERLARTLHPDVSVIPQGPDLPQADGRITVMDLPLLFRTRLETIPADVPYLRTDPASVAAWRARLSGPGLKVGVVWQGNPLHTNDARRSFPLAALAPVAAVPGVRLVSLQKAPGLDQLDTLPAGMSVERLDGDLELEQTAAVMEALDLVITCDSAPAHLAGALARPVWIGIPHIPDWRWQRTREDSPWYPTARLFRQAAPGDWDGVFARMADALRRSAP